jgi:hypothetical protein
VFVVVVWIVSLINNYSAHSLRLKARTVDQGIE